MNFEVKLPHNMDVWALRAAGLVADRLTDLMVDCIEKKVSLPVELECRYFFSEAPVTARVTVFDFGRGGVPAYLKVQVPNAAIGKKIRERLVRYSVENDGKTVSDRERQAVLARIKSILKPDAISFDKLQGGEAVLSRRAMESLMQLCEETEHPWHELVYDLFWSKTVLNADRVFVGHWLIKLFAKERDPNEQIGMRLWFLAVPQIADDLIRLIKDRRYGDRRGPLCLALAKTKHPRAGVVISSVLKEDGVTRWALEALGKLKAGEHVETVRKFLRHPDADVRREAKRTLKKMGFPVETPPQPVHLVKKRIPIPKDMEEWSANLDIEDLASTLKKLTRCIDQGFGSDEVAEVAGVADEMKTDQTRTFRFPVSAKGQEGELWIEVFMDDIDAPDLAVYASPPVIERLRAAVDSE